MARRIKTAIEIIVDRAGDSLPCHVSVDIEYRLQRLARALQGNLIVAERQHGLFQLRPLLKSLLHQLLDRLFLLGNLLHGHAVGGNHRGNGKRRIIQVAGHGLLDDLLLIVEGALRGDEGLLVAVNTRIVLHHLQRGHGADLQLLAVVAGQLGALRQGALLGLHILIGLHQPPIDGLHLIDGVENLLAEGGIGDAAIVARLIDVALVDPDAGALQQVLGNRGLESGT